MHWNDIKKLQPLNGQLIIPYSKDMHYYRWIEQGTLPVMEWNEEKKMAFYGKDYVDITHWLPVPLEPKIKIN